jgi:hypothetical protein
MHFYLNNIENPLMHARIQNSFRDLQAVGSDVTESLFGDVSIFCQDFLGAEFSIAGPAKKMDAFSIYRQLNFFVAQRADEPLFYTGAGWIIHRNQFLISDIIPIA